ncbi:WSCD family member CG9164-like [Pecten maximus]|uniref:WSCD family member CG9164-like n=1 Tax=Pecten maximus TaxID=6579 RepID=UPI001458219C|nr:WSCD family member CG9164-like [Pecten maximus]
MSCYENISTCVWKIRHIALAGVMILTLLLYYTTPHSAVTHLPAPRERMELSHVELSGKQLLYVDSNRPVKIFNEEEESCQPRKLSFLPGRPKYRTALLSFPGSGNTWVRHLIQELTGFYTGSIYQDKTLAKNGFPGELEPVTNPSRHCIVYKSHQATTKTLQPFNKALIIIRNPLYAIKSVFNFEYSREKQSDQKQFMNVTKNVEGRSRKSKLVIHNVTSRNKHVNHADTSLFHTEKWRSFVNEKLRRWKKKNIFWMTTFQHNCAIVLYESLKYNCSSELLRIGRFLGVNLQPKDVWCTLVNKEGRFHRPAMNKTAPSLLGLYTPIQREEIRKSICEVANVARKLDIDIDIAKYLVNLSEKSETVC